MNAPKSDRLEKSDRLAIESRRVARRSKAAAPIAVVSALVAVIAFGWIRQEATILGEVLAFILSVFAFARFPTLKKFKALGLEMEVAHLREERTKTREVTEEATATLLQLRKVASVLGRFVLSELALSGSGTPPLLRTES
jgi:hypothetical protein